VRACHSHYLRRLNIRTNGPLGCKSNPFKVTSNATTWYQLLAKSVNAKSVLVKAQPYYTVSVLLSFGGASNALCPVSLFDCLYAIVHGIAKLSQRQDIKGFLQLHADVFDS